MQSFLSVFERSWHILTGEGCRAFCQKVHSRLWAAYEDAVYGRSRRAHIPTMLTTHEQDYLYSFAKSAYSGCGEIVDLGCWLGGSTVPLAQGLEKNRKRLIDKRVHAYDRFVWNEWMANKYKNIVLQKFAVGDSFVNEFKTNIAPWADRVVIHEGDLCEEGWCGDPIEFLFIDAMKSWVLTNTVLHNFFPALMPGVSTIVHQDFLHFNEPWIHLICYRFREYFEPVLQIPHSSSLVFKYVAPIPRNVLKHSYHFRSFFPDEVDLAFDYALRIVEEDFQPNIVAAKVTYHTYRRDLEHAKHELELARSRGLSFRGQLGIAEERIRRVMIAGILIDSADPIGEDVIIAQSQLEPDVVRSTLRELENLGMIETVAGCKGSVSATEKCHAWFESSFEKRQ